MIIAVDTGNRFIKTSNAQPFVAGLVRHFDTPPIVGTDTLFFNGNYYSFSETQDFHRQDKTVDDYYFVLTLAAIAREILVKRTNDFVENFEFKPNMSKIVKAAQTKGAKFFEEIDLCVGLPPRDMKSQSERFKKYFITDGPISFTYNKIPFEIDIRNVFVFPQGLTAITRKSIFEEISKYPQSYLVDIGGYTTDIGCVANKKIRTDFYESLDYGVIHLYHKCIDAVGKECSKNINSVLIEAILNGADIGNKEVETVVKKCADEYAHSIIAMLRDKGIDLELSFPVFMGGGSILLEDSLRKALNRNTVWFMNDVSLNAKAYEAMGNKMLADITKK